jgi:DNA-3-methyladenine glycosylase
MALRRPRWPGDILPRSFYQRDAREVAQALLNKVLACDDGRAGRIVEVEAYLGAIDPAAHTFRGKTARNAVMFGPPGHMYVYFTYGMHWCANTVCGDVGEGTGVLIRALEPIAGIERMREARPKVKRESELCSGPARLAQAMSITGEQNGIDLVRARQGYAILDDGTPSPENVPGSARIGIRQGTDLLWRWLVAGNPHVSRA